MKLSEHIETILEDFDRLNYFKTTKRGLLIVDEKIIKSFLKQSLKSIAYKSIDAVRVKERLLTVKDFPFENTEELTSLHYALCGRNVAMKESAQKEKEYKDE